MNKASTRNNRPAVKSQIKREIPARKFEVNTNIPALVKLLKEVASPQNAKTNN